MDLLQQVEQTRLSMWVSHSGSLLAFPTILLLHTYGMAILVGLVGLIDLRILGFAPAVPLASLERFFPAVWAAFWINAVSGTLLVLSEATKLANVDFAVKMLLIFAAVINLHMLRARVFRAPQYESTHSATEIPRGAKTLACASLACWLGAITAGRLLAYVR
jgi:hypothetical protein